jgi:hypothetical protein
MEMIEFGPDEPMSLHLKVRLGSCRTASLTTWSAA